MADLQRDLRFGLRLLARSPVFTVTASLLLAIGISANTLIFSAVDTLLLRPLPVKDPERLVRLVEVHPTGFVTWDLPYSLCELLSAKVSSVTGAVCQGDLDVGLREGASTERVRLNVVTSNFFSTLGLSAHFGRVLTPDDEKVGAMPAVLSYDFWRRRFAGAREIVGRSIALNGHSFTVTGVLPKGVNGLTVDTTPDIRVPLAAARLLTGKPFDAPDGGYFGFQIFGRLRPGVTLASSEAEVSTVLRPAYEELLGRVFPPAANGGQKFVLDSRLRLEPAGKGVSALRAQFSRGLLVLMMFVGLLLLMACANVAGLLLARSAARAREIGLRRALGASNWRIVRQLLSETVLLAVFGGTLGVALAFACVPVLRSALPPIRDRAAVVQPLAVDLDVDLRVLGFALFVTLCTALFSGISPAVRAARSGLTGAVRGERTVTRRHALQKAIVAAQVAICTLLLLGAGVLVETLQRMRSMDAGFDRDHVITFTVDPALRQYTEERTSLLSRQLLEKAASLPSVVAASVAGRGLMRGTGVKATFAAAGTPISSSDFLNTSLNWITPGYFDTMGMRILAGRDFTWFDHNTSKPTKVIVNDTFARRFFPGQDPIGRRFGNKGPDGLAAAGNEIIGVVTDAKYRSLRETIPPTVYTPMVDGFRSAFILHIRTKQQPDSIAGQVRGALRSLDPELPFVEVSTLHDEVDASLWQERLLAKLSALFGFLAALLAGIGLYGALDHAVRGRTREIGVRVAVGAGPLRIVRLLAADTLLPVFVGVVGGMAAYALLARWIELVLYEVQPWNAFAVGTTLVLVLAIATVSTVAPTWRAVRIDPAAALRQE